MELQSTGAGAARVVYVPRRLGRVTLLAAALLLVVGCRTALGAALLPPPGRVFAGETGQPVSQYVSAVGKHPAVYGVFEPWGGWIPGPFADAAAVRARLMLHISTVYGCCEAITPGAIARGAGDRWLIALNAAAAASGHPWYARLMAEMDAYWSPYSAYGADGRPRDANHSTAAFKRAWRRATLILRGGTLKGIDATLRSLRMPALRAGHDLPRTQVAMVWVPQVAGAPDMPGNEPRDYWPGSRWVDWIGTDFYSNAPNYSGLNALYAAFPGFPFAFAEYAMWDTPDGPGFVQSLFAWIGSHRRTRMLLYNQGARATGPLRLYRFPAAARALRAHLASPTFLAFTSDW